MTASTVLLGKIAKITSGGTPSRDNPSYWGGEIPWVKTTQVQNCVIKLADIDERITAEGSRRSSAKMIPAGSILMAMVGQGKTRGQVAILNIDAAINQNCAAIILKNGMDRNYVYQQLRFQYEEIRNASNSSGQQNLNAALVRSLRIPLLNYADQKSIGILLAEWDAAIEKTEQLIAAKLRAKDSYAIFLLAAKHPDFKRADELFTPVSEKGRDDLQILSVTQDQGVIPRSMLDKQILMEASSVSSFKVVREGDFVISLRSFQGGLEYSPYDGVVSPAYTVLRPRKDVYPEFFRHYLKSKDFLKRLSVAVIGIRDGKQINFSDFASIKLPVPPRDAQVQYAEFFDAIEREVVLLKRQNDSLKKQKRGLMQKLLTGQWRMAKPVSKEL